MAICSKCRTVWKMKEHSSCPKCTKTKNKQQQKQYDSTKRDRSQKAVYNTKAWEELRVQVFIRDGFKCVKCDTPVGIKPKDHAVDHIVEIKDGGAKYNIDNLELLCAKCHRQKTENEKAKRKNTSI